MPAIESLIDAHSPQFAQNREAMLAAIAQLRQLEHALLSKAQEAKPKFDTRGQLLPRERLQPFERVRDAGEEGERGRVGERHRA